jgi:coenzyme F420-dependent glucose-6-phosphate dehydrogenase
MPDLRLGWWLSSEEHSPRALVDHARLAEATGFPTAMLSDHLLPWVTSQGHAGHVWTTLGAIAMVTDRLEVGTGVVAMVHRAHPIDVAHAAATVAVLFEDRFFLGVGAGERLNEQAYGERWLRPGERRRRMKEAVQLLRRLAGGEKVNHRGEHFNVESLQLATRPAAPAPIYLAASGKRSAALAGTIGDGLILVTPDAQLVAAYRGAGGTGRCLGQLHVSIAGSIDEAEDNAWEWWPNGALPPALLPELARPEHFEAAAGSTRRDAIHQGVVCVTDADAVVAAIDRFVGAGCDTVYLHQVGPDQARLADLASAELLPHYGSAG